jgi:hypothetical protein
MPFSAHSAEGRADVGGKAVTLVITAAAARTLNADAFGVMALAMATGWLLGVATDAGLSMHLGARNGASTRATGRRQLPDRSAAAARRPRLRGGDDDRVFHAVDRSAALEDAVRVDRVRAAHRRDHRNRRALLPRHRAQRDSNPRSTRRIASRRWCWRSIVLSWWPRLDFLGAAMLVPR